MFAMVESPVVIAITPGHEASPNPSRFMHEIVSKIDYPKFAGGKKQYQNQEGLLLDDGPRPHMKVRFHFILQLLLQLVLLLCRLPLISTKTKLLSFWMMSGLLAAHRVSAKMWSRNFLLIDLAVYYWQESLTAHFLSFFQAFMVTYSVQ